MQDWEQEAKWLGQKDLILQALCNAERYAMRRYFVHSDKAVWAFDGLFWECPLLIELFADKEMKDLKDPYEWLNGQVCCQIDWLREHGTSAARP